MPDFNAGEKYHFFNFSIKVKAVSASYLMKYPKDEHIQSGVQNCKLPMSNLNLKEKIKNCIYLVSLKNMAHSPVSFKVKIHIFYTGCM